MLDSEIEARVLLALQNFQSLPFGSVRDKVLCQGGNYTIENEVELKDALRRLTARKMIGAADPQWGPFWLARSAVSGDAVGAGGAGGASRRRARQGK